MLDPKLLVLDEPVSALDKSVQAQVLSGGEQQMLAIARAMLTGPDLLLLDEPSQGLAPLVVETVMRTI